MRSLTLARSFVRKRKVEIINNSANRTIVTNPPWGVRLGEREEAEALLSQLGDFLKQRCRGSIAWLYFGDRELVKSVGLRPARRIPLRAGGLDGRLVAYELW